MSKKHYNEAESDPDYEYVRNASDHKSRQDDEKTSKSSKHRYRSPSRSRYTDADPNDDEFPEEVVEIKELFFMLWNKLILPCSCLSYDEFIFAFLFCHLNVSVFYPTF